MARIHPAVLNMAFTTLGEPKPRRCHCWLVVLSILFGFIAYLTFMCTLAHV